MALRGSEAGEAGKIRNSNHTKKKQQQQQETPCCLQTRKRNKSLGRILSHISSQATSTKGQGLGLH
eukprot:m.30600 g.30600  ORF g.30600 m.30600 type:complete len:66 (-) comp14596_c0_seq3:92-289(-)